MPLRLGVHCAVRDDEGALLLSRREDLNVWNLPGGRVDAGESLAETAAREVEEETGIIAHVGQPIGLYFWDKRARLNIVYAGLPVGGELRQTTAETRANRYFATGALPTMPAPVAQMTADALRGPCPTPRILTLSRRDHLLLQLALRGRWLRNWLMGRPEPAHVDFRIDAVAIIRDADGRRLIVEPGQRESRLPRVPCDGTAAPWVQLAAHVERTTGIAATFRWVGVWQAVAQQHVELIFAAVVDEADYPAAHRVTARNVALQDRDAAYLARLSAASARDLIWSLTADDTAGAGAVLVVDKKG